MFTYSYVRFSLNTVHKYDNVHSIMKLIKQVSLFFTPWLGRYIDDTRNECYDNCIENCGRLKKIRGKHKVKWAETRKRDTVASILGQKNGQALVEPAGPAKMALLS